MSGGYEGEHHTPSVIWFRAYSSTNLLFHGHLLAPTAEMSKSIVKGIGIGFLSCIGIGIAKTISQVLVLVLVLLRRQTKYWYWYC